MKIGLISDSHGNLRFLHRAVDLLLIQGAEEFWHLGDEHADAQEISYQGLPLVVVPGNRAREYHDGRLPKVRCQAVDGWVFLLAHTPEDAVQVIRDTQTMRDTRTRAGAGAGAGAGNTAELHAVCHGHTHHYHVGLGSDGLAWINPGHLKAPFDRGRPPSCGLLEATEGLLQVRILDLDGLTLVESSFRQPGL